MVLTVDVRVLSTPSAEYDVTAKYQVPEVRPVIVYEARPGLDPAISCL